MNLGGLFDKAQDAATGVAGDVAQGVADAQGTMDRISKIPGRGLIWEIDLADPQKFTFTPLGRVVLGTAAAFGLIKMIGGR